jgi:hypothetical protein
MAYVTIKLKSFYDEHLRFHLTKGYDNGTGIATLLSTMWHTNQSGHATLPDLRTPGWSHAQSSRYAPEEFGRLCKYAAGRSGGAQSGIYAAGK